MLADTFVSFQYIERLNDKSLCYRDESTNFPVDDETRVRTLICAVCYQLIDSRLKPGH